MKMNVILNNCDLLSQYDTLLSRFSNWTMYKRDINLSTLLEEGKRIEFIVEVEVGNLVIFYHDQKMTHACALINKLKFILNNGIIEDLEIEFNLINTDTAKIIKEFIEDNIPVYIYSEKDKDSDQIINFLFIFDLDNISHIPAKSVYNYLISKGIDKTDFLSPDN